MPQWRYIEREIKDWGAIVLFFPSPLIWKGKKIFWIFVLLVYLFFMISNPDENHFCYGILDIFHHLSVMNIFVF